MILASCNIGWPKKSTDIYANSARETKLDSVEYKNALNRLKLHSLRAGSFYYYKCSLNPTDKITGWIVQQPIKTYQTSANESKCRFVYSTFIKDYYQFPDTLEYIIDIKDPYKSKFVYLNRTNSKISIDTFKYNAFSIVNDPVNSFLRIYKFSYFDGDNCFTDYISMELGVLWHFTTSGDGCFRNDTWIFDDYSNISNYYNTLMDNVKKDILNDYPLNYCTN